MTTPTLTTLAQALKEAFEAEVAAMRADPDLEGYDVFELKSVSTYTAANTILVEMGFPEDCDCFNDDPTDIENVFDRFRQMFVEGRTQVLHTAFDRFDRFYATTLIDREVVGEEEIPEMDLEMYSHELIKVPFTYGFCSTRDFRTIEFDVVVITPGI